MLQSSHFKLKGIKQTAEDLAYPLPPLVLEAERVAENVSLGIHGRRKPGMGEAFWNFRPYLFGDETAKIDWRQTAKTETVYIREKEAEVTQSVWLWRDASESMHYTSSRRYMTKLQYANLMILATGALLTRAGEQYTFLDAGLPLSSGRLALRRIAQLVDSKKGEDANIKTASLPHSVNLPQNAFVILIGDFLVPPLHLKRLVAKMISHKVRGHVMHIYDEAEKNLPFQGRIRFQDLESDQGVLIKNISDIRSEYKDLFSEHVQEIEQITKQANWTFSSHSTAQKAEKTLLDFYTVVSSHG